MILIVCLLPVFFLFFSCQASSSSIEQPTQTAQDASYCQFERPPYLGIFEIGGEELTLIGLHAKPDYVFQELNMIEKVVTNKGLKDFVLLGDLNADCDYLSDSEYQQLRIFNLFSWLIDKDADTNVASTECAYDRIAVNSQHSFENATVREIPGNLSDHHLVSTEVLIGGESFSIAAWNLERYGSSKASEGDTTGAIREIVSNYDIILLQEVTSSDASVVDAIRPESHSALISEELGSSSYKERYVYMYSPRITSAYAEVTDISSCEPPPLGKVPNADGQNNSGNQTVPANPTCSVSGYSCGSAPYWTPRGYCYATVDGRKIRRKNCCCE